MDNNFKCEIFSQGDVMANLQEAASFFNRDEKTILWWVTQGMPKEARNNYDLLMCARWRIEKLEKDVEIAERGDETLYQVRIQSEKLKNEQRKLQLARLEGELVSKDEVMAMWTQEMGIINRNMDGMLENICVAAGADALIRNKLQMIIDDVRSRIVETKINLVDELEESGQWSVDSGQLSVDSSQESAGEDD